MFEYQGPAQVSGYHQINLPKTFPLEDDVWVEVKLYKKKPTSHKTLRAEHGPEEFDKYVSAFWSRYPKRNGKHLNKRSGQDELNKIKSTEIDAVLKGAENFAKSKQAIDGYAPDAFRWLKKRGWEDWQDGPEQQQRNRITL
jgi:hypothetical protein